MTFLREIKNKRILVVGDVMVDSFVYGSGYRLSQEAPVPVVLVNKKVSRLGGACNVAANLAALGCGVTLCGIVGKDVTADICRDLLDQTKIDSHLYVSSSEQTIHKTRIICDDQHVVRFDEEKKFSSGAEGMEENLNEVNNCDAVIVSDYAKGTINKRIIDIVKAKFSGKPIIVDPKPSNSDLYYGVTTITPNLTEARSMLGCPSASPKDCARMLQDKFKCQFIIVTLSDKGILLYSDNEYYNLDAHPISMTDASRPQKRDVTGAGDTFISAFTASYCSGLSLKESVYIANVAAAVAVNKMGTEVCSDKELEEELENG